jgi:hypothetical protein
MVLILLGGTSLLLRNFRNSRARWRWWTSPITLPFFVFSAANKVVVPWRV